MLYGFLVTLFVIACLLLIVLILMQKSKGGMGIGTMGGGSQMLFGGAGGQDFFQKTTWVLGTILMAGSLGLGLMKARSGQGARYAPIEAPAVNPLLDMAAAPEAAKPETVPASTATPPVTSQPLVPGTADQKPAGSEQKKTQG